VIACLIFLQILLVIVVWSECCIEWKLNLRSPNMWSLGLEYRLLAAL